MIIGQLFCATSSFVHYSIAICEFKLLQSRNTQIGAKFVFDLCDLGLWPLILTFYMDIAFVNGNNSSKLKKLERPRAEIPAAA